MKQMYRIKELTLQKPNNDFKQYILQKRQFLKDVEPHQRPHLFLLCFIGFVISLGVLILPSVCWFVYLIMSDPDFNYINISIHSTLDEAIEAKVTEENKVLLNNTATYYY